MSYDILNRWTGAQIYTSDTAESIADAVAGCVNAEDCFKPERGDHILSPKDERCPYMDLGAEVKDEADAMSVMRAFYPTHPDRTNRTPDSSTTTL